MSEPYDNKLMNEVNLQEIVEVPMFGKKNVILDATVLSTLMNCARLADLRFNHNLLSINGKSNSLECGSVVHKFMEVMYGCQINGMKREQAVQHGFAAAEMYIHGCKFCTNFEPTPELLKPECGHKVNDFPGVKNTPRESEGYKIGWQWVLETCDQYQQHYKSDHWVPLEVEVVKGEILYEDDEVRVLWKAKLDLVSDTNQGIYPIDHKTMKQRRNTTSLNNQFIGQCLLQKTRGMFVNKIGFQTSLKPEEKFQRAMVNYTPARFIEWQSEILPYYAKALLMYAEMGYFPPNFTHCEGKFGNCAFIDVCQADPGMREEEIKLHFFVGPEWNPTNEDDVVAPE